MAATASNVDNSEWKPVWKLREDDAVLDRPLSSEGPPRPHGRARTSIDPTSRRQIEAGAHAALNPTTRRLLLGALSDPFKDSAGVSDMMDSMDDESSPLDYADRSPQYIELKPTSSQHRKISYHDRNYKLWFLAGVISVAVIVVLGGWGISGLVEHGPDTYPEWWNSAISSAGHDGCWALAVLGTALGTFGLLTSLVYGFNQDVRFKEHRYLKSIEESSKALLAEFTPITKEQEAMLPLGFKESTTEKLFYYKMREILDYDFFIKENGNISHAIVSYDDNDLLPCYLQNTGWTQALFR